MSTIERSVESIMAKEDIHVIISGSRNAGISSFINQMAGDYEPHDESGMGIDIQSASVYVNKEEYNILFYEIASTFPLDSLKKIFQKKNVGIAIMFDVSNAVSLEFAELIYNQIAEKLGTRLPRVKFLLGSHSDLPKAMPQEAIDALMAGMGGKTYYLEFSAKTGERLLESLERLAQRILEK
ncbi:MAG: GTPase domain-containing protein [Candidatus Lokiarchaeota archaeon]|nr:GTPase domain-containing protein [Candidatus Lokiarchaeota archaeon]